MLHAPLWKKVLVWAVGAMGLLLAMPNLFYAQVEMRNDAEDAATKAGFVTTEQQAAMDGWPSYLPHGLVNLGLDLRGGAHLLAEVQVSDVYKARMDGLWPEVRDALRDKRAEVGSIRRQPAPEAGTLRVEQSNPTGMATAVEAVKALASPVTTLSGAGQSDLEVTADGAALVVRLSDAERTATDARTLQQSLEIIRTRVDQAGTREPTIQ